MAVATGTLPVARAVRLGLSLRLTHRVSCHGSGTHRDTDSLHSGCHWHRGEINLQLVLTVPLALPVAPTNKQTPLPVFTGNLNVPVTRRSLTQAARNTGAAPGRAAGLTPSLSSRSLGLPVPVPDCASGGLCQCALASSSCQLLLVAGRPSHTVTLAHHWHCQPAVSASGIVLLLVKL